MAAGAEIQQAMVAAAAKGAGEAVGHTTDIGNDYLKGLQQFTSLQCSDGVSIVFEFPEPIYPGNVAYAKDFPELAALGIQYIQCVRDDGHIYTYSFYVCNTRPLKIRITDGEPDTYRLQCQTTGKHHVNFNSDQPGVYSIAVELL